MLAAQPLVNMITESTTTEDLIATFNHARSLSEASFEQGCTVLNAIELFDQRTTPGKLGAWRQYNNILPLVPVTDAWDDSHAHRLVCDRLAQGVVTWTDRQLLGAHGRLDTVFTAWVVIDRATRVTWVECSPVKNQRTQHPRDLREAGEFPSSARGTVDAHVFLRMGETWHEVLDSVLEAYHEAKRLLDGETA